MAYDLRPIKRFIRENYPRGHPLQIIIQERDTVEDPKELIGKAEVWLRLSHL